MSDPTPTHPHWPDTVAEAPLEGVDERIRRFRAVDEVDTYVIALDHLLVVVDTHSTPALARQLVDLLEPLRPGRALVVIDSHADYDHAWGNQVFLEPGQLAPIIGSRRCAERLSGDEGRASVARLSGEMPGRFDGLVLTPPNVVLDGEAAFRDGRLTVEALPAPGHSEDHLALYLPELRTLLPGDASEWPWPHVDGAAAFLAAHATLERLRALDPRIVLPCHGGQRDATILDLNLRYLDAVRADPTLSLEAACAIVDADPAALHAIYLDFHADACRSAAALRG